LRHKKLSIEISGIQISNFEKYGSPFCMPAMPVPLPGGEYWPPTPSRNQKNNSPMNNISLVMIFDITSQAIEKPATVFESVLKPRKNFHIYIHGSKGLTEKDG
jgi:hypothetical protein